MEINQGNTDEHTIPTGKANAVAFFLVIPITIIFLGPFLLFWNFELVRIGKNIILENFLVILVAGVIVHELLHALVFALFAKKGFRSIRFGINWKYLTPYCHCSEPLKVWQYRLGGAMPLIAMGIIPSIAGIITGSGFLVCFGIFFSWAAGGDIIVLYMLRKLKKNTFVYDHPQKIGFCTTENYTS